MAKPNTRTVLGDQNCADAILSRTITEFNDDTVTTVGYRVFYSCQALTSVELPALTRIEENGFFNCTAMTSMDLGQVSYISDKALDCPNLSSLTLRNTTSVCNYNSTASAYYPGRNNKDNFTIYVPANLLSAYLSSRWAAISNNITALTED